MSGAINNLNNQLNENLAENATNVDLKAAAAGEALSGLAKSSHKNLESPRLKVQNSGEFDTVPNLELQARAVTKSPTHK